LAWRDIKLRYKQTIFGIGWAVLQPFMMMVVFSIIFGKIAQIPSDNIPYPIFSYAGLLFWNLFSNSLTNASQSLVSSASIIQKVYLPRIILPTSSIIVTMVDFFFAFLVLTGIMFYYNFMPHLLGVILLLPLLFITFIASLGLGLFFSALNVKYRDIRYALPFFIQILIFVTPVIYPSGIISDKYRWILSFNPMTGVIEAFKASFLGSAPVNWVALAISVAASIIFLILGLWYFLKTEKNFADVI
jgi:lipopolysaccharide transport system permease protein